MQSNRCDDVEKRYGEVGGGIWGGGKGEGEGRGRGGGGGGGIMVTNLFRFDRIYTGTKSGPDIFSFNTIQTL
jgi:hypothetical protein